MTFAPLQAKPTNGKPAVQSSARTARIEGLDRPLLPVGRDVTVAFTEKILKRQGEPLSVPTLSRFEDRFHFDFSRVRVHADAHAADVAQGLGAAAYTMGADIGFAAGRYAPQTAEGSRLLAHELAHVVQQTRPGAPVTPSDEALERDANGAAAAFARSSAPIQVAEASAGRLSLQPETDTPPMGLKGSRPRYLASLDQRLDQIVIKQVTYWAEEVGPLADIQHKYPRMPFRKDAVLDIPALDFSQPIQISDKEPLQGRFQLHSQLLGGYELLDYHQPWVILVHAGKGYVLDDKIFTWMFGQEFPRLYEDFEEPSRFQHEHPWKYLAARIGMDMFPLPMNPNAFLATFLFPFLPGIGELGAIPEGGYFVPEPDVPVFGRDAVEPVGGGGVVEPDTPPAPPPAPRTLEPYINKNPAATSSESQMGTFLDQRAQQGSLKGTTRVQGAPEAKGVQNMRSGDYRFVEGNGALVRADLFEPKTTNLRSIVTSIFKKSGQAEIAVVKLGEGTSGQLTQAQARTIAEDVLSTPGHGIERVIVINNGEILVDLP